MNRTIYKRLDVELPYNSYIDPPLPGPRNRRLDKDVVLGETWTKYVPTWWERIKGLIGRKGDGWTSWILVRHKATRRLWWVEYHGFETWASMVQRWEQGQTVTMSFGEWERGKLT